MSDNVININGKDHNIDTMSDQQKYLIKQIRALTAEEEKLAFQLDPIRVAGGLFEAYDDDGVMIDPGYNVVVNSNINPATQLATGVVKAQVGVRV